MSDTHERALEALPYVAVNNLELITGCLKNGQDAIIHRHATMEDPYSLEVVASLKKTQDISRLSLTGTFAFPHNVEPSSVYELREKYLPTIKAFNLGSVGISTAYTNNEKKALKLSLDDAETSVATWFSRGGQRPFLFFVSNDRRDGRDNNVASTPPKFEEETIEECMARYMKLLSIVDKALGGSSSNYAVNFLELRTAKRTAQRQTVKASPQEKTKIKAIQSARTKLETEAKQLDETYQVHTPNPNAKLSEVRGILAEDHDKLNEKILTFKYPELAEQWGVESSGGILLYGSPGTGKTMTATAISNEIDGRIWQISGPDIVDKWVGNAAAHTKQLFENAKKMARLGPLVLFFDEIDSIITNDDNQSTERSAALGEFKSHLEDVAINHPNILVIATTNHPERIDKASKRKGRFDLNIYMELPDAQARLDILMDHISFKEVNEVRMFEETQNFNFTKLVEAAGGMSGADIAGVIKDCRAAKFRDHAIQGLHPGPIAQEDIMAQINQFFGQSKEHHKEA